MIWFWWLRVGQSWGQKLRARVVERNEKGSGVDVAETDVAAGDGA